MKAVSVIIPIYNVEEYIEECLVSVVNQTLKNIEIICVNDGTPDNSMEIVQKYAANDERIIIVNKKNGGLSSARNAGLKVASGEYVYFIDSDDYIKEDMLEYLYAQAVKDDLDSIYFDAESFFENEKLEEEQKSYVNYYQRQPIYTKVVSGQQLLCDMVKNKEFRPSACLQMNKLSVLKENNINFFEGIIHEDNLFSVRITLYAKRAKHVSEAFYMRRLRENSIMTTAGAKRSAYGYFISMTKLLPEIATAVKDEECLEIYMEHLRRMRNNAERVLRDLSDSDFEKLKIDTNAEEMLLFEFIVKDYAQQMRLRMRQTPVATCRKGLLKCAEEKIKRRRLKCKKRGKKIKYGIYLVAEYGIKSVRVIKQKGIKKFLKKVISRLTPRKIVEKNSKVSIIIPVYNGKKYLEACIVSLRQQSMKNIEILCIDDQSTDGSYEMLQEYAKKDRRIKVFQQEHLGAGEARNLGIKNSTGKYLLFLDCDDYFDKDLCRNACQKAEKYNAEIVLFGAERVDMQKNEKQKMGWVLRSAQIPEEKVFSGKDISKRLFQITSNCPWSKMFRKDFVEKNNLCFQNTKHANDVYFVRTAMSMAERMVMLDEILVTYRYNDGANTQSRKYLAPLEFYKALVAVKRRLESENLFEIYRHSYINWILTECFFNYETMKNDEAKKIIKEKLLNGGFDELGITGCREDDFDTQDLYDRYKVFCEK